jgi:hypothetical protein
LALTFRSDRLCKLVGALLGCAAAFVCLPVKADLNAPVWYDEGPAVADWHYRVPITVPGGAGLGSTVETDVDFTTLLDSMNIDSAAVAFDANSPRVVRGDGSLASEQEFTDAIFAGGLDATGNARGQVRFILQDAPATGYYLYFDITANGVKPVNPATVINGHFEQSNGATPSRWTTSAVNAGGNQNNEVHTTNLGQTINLTAGCGNTAANGVDIGPNNIAGTATGRNWHLLGFRDLCEDGGGVERIQLTRSIAVPGGGAAGVLEFYFQVQAFDGISNATNYDWFEFSVDGATVNHNGLGIDNTPAPTLVIENNRLGRSGYGGIQDFGWKRAQLDLAPYAGTTISFRVQSRHSDTDNSYRSWLKLDDVVWSLQIGTLGNAEAFGTNITTPNDTAVVAASEYQQGSTLAIQATADVDVSVVTADVYDDNGVLVATNILLFDDGTHGDGLAGDQVWSNDGSIPAEPTYTFGAGPFGGNWLVRVYALDLSIAANGVTDGLVMIPGGATAPENQVNFYNVDEQLFTLRGALVDVAKTLETLQDSISVAEPKSIPGAWIRYEVRVENQGPDGLDSDSITIVDEIPADVAVCVSAVCTCSGPACTQVDPVQFDESSSPISTGLTYDYGTQVSYSLDGVDYTYLPAPDGDGFDPNVRYVRVRPSGAMNQPSGSSNAEFELRYVVRLE